MGESGDGGDLGISSKNDDTKTTRPLKKPLLIEPPEEVEKHTPSPITIPMFKKPPVERRDLIDSSQSSIRNSGVPGQKSVEGQSKIKAETMEKNTKGSEKGVKQKANAMKRTENATKQINKLQKNSEKRPDSSSREKLWAELQKARGERKVAENKRQELVKQAKMTTSKMNQKRTSVRDIWKKKFFEEKKKTMPLNDVLNRLQQEFNKLHHRLVSVLDDQKTFGRQKVQVLPVTKVLPSIKNNTR
uniref:Spermatogenesis-associated protein 1 C-terminal domain-containing protein n=1 Tax=Ciona savignyi TaxID=51511 RepID=H2ZM61_CIOSA